MTTTSVIGCCTISYPVQTLICITTASAAGGRCKRNCSSSLCSSCSVFRRLKIQDSRSESQTRVYSMVSVHAISRFLWRAEAMNLWYAVRDLALQLLQKDIQHMDIPDQSGESGTIIGTVHYTVSKLATSCLGKNPYFILTRMDPL